MRRDTLVDFFSDLITIRGDFLVYFERGTAPRWWMHGWYD